MGRLQVAIDRGGTFTDVVARTSDGQILTMKLLSEDPEKYPDAPTEAIRRLLKQVIRQRLFIREIECSFDSGSFPAESRGNRLDSNGHDCCDECLTGAQR